MTDDVFDGAWRQQYCAPMGVELGTLAARAPAVAKVLDGHAAERGGNALREPQLVRMVCLPAQQMLAGRGSQVSASAKSPSVKFIEPGSSISNVHAALVSAYVRDNRPICIWVASAAEKLAFFASLRSWIRPVDRPAELIADMAPIRAGGALRGWVVAGTISRLCTRRVTAWGARAEACLQRDILGWVPRGFTCVA